ncbi:pseudouridine synthase [Jannaschia sp. 2305UL9-9]|uniref:pseudouridine synthase n=1 Tax=Jannaschia sp. 2305UL9-9 TaxID=3121638 RepID=UPI003528CCAF
MTDSTDTPAGDRLAKVIARAGLASRRDAETMIADLRVTVNGRTISSPATNVLPGDRITVDGKPLPQKDDTRVWMYHKPAGLVTTERDEKDRETVFDALRDRLGRVLSIGRLDLTSEGLLLLTNDGDLKRRLELPETGWLRRYRVRVNGRPDEAALQKLRDGVEVDGERFQGMQVTFDRQQGANAWLTVGLREGRNREIRRAAEVVGLYVNRLIRVSYGPFQLGTLAPDEVEEIKPRVLRDQLETIFDGTFAESRRDMAEPQPSRKAPRGDAPGGPRRDARPARDDGPTDRPKGGKPRNRQDDDRAPRAPRGDRSATAGKPRTAKPPFTRNDDQRPPRGKPGDRPAQGGPRRGPKDDANPRRRSDDDRAPRGDRLAAKGKTEQRQSKSERKAAMRADTSVSLRKGGQRGRGISKPTKAPGGKPYTKPPKR